jgi:hypothetical protein
MLLEPVNATVDHRQELVKVKPLLLLYRRGLEEQIHEQALSCANLPVYVHPARNTWKRFVRLLHVGSNFRLKIADI